MSQTERVVDVHFISGHTLRLRGLHVAPFMKSYMNGVDKNMAVPHFYSRAEDEVLIQMSHVEFVQVHEVEKSIAELIKEIDAELFNLNKGQTDNAAAEGIS